MQKVLSNPLKSPDKYFLACKVATLLMCIPWPLTWVASVMSLAGQFTAGTPPFEGNASPARPRKGADLYFALFKLFRENGIELPFPQRDLHLRSSDIPFPYPGAKEKL